MTPHSGIGADLRFSASRRSVGLVAADSSTCVRRSAEVIASAVEALCAAGIETFESCQGGNGHAEPTMRIPRRKIGGILRSTWRCGPSGSPSICSSSVGDREPAGRSSLGTRSHFPCWLSLVHSSHRVSRRFQTEGSPSPMLLPLLHSVLLHRLLDRMPGTRLGYDSTPSRGKENCGATATPA